MKKMIKGTELLFAASVALALGAILVELFCQGMILFMEGEFIGWGFTTLIKGFSIMAISIAALIVAMAAIFAIVMLVACLLSWTCENRNAKLERFFEKVTRYAGDCLCAFWPRNW